MLEFKNPVLKPFIVLIFAFSFNDALSTPLFNGIPVTPVQIAVLYGIYYTLSWKVSFVNIEINDLKKSIGLYYLVLVTSTIYMSSSGLNLSFLTVGFNVLWFFRMLPFLSYGFLNQGDIDKFLRLFLKIIVFITVPSGLYELITHTHILSFSADLEKDIFYLQGFHSDKLEFASMLATGCFISLSNIFKDGEKVDDRFNKVAFFLCAFLILFSFSTTSILGMCAGIAVIMMYKSVKTLVYIPVLALLGFGVVYFIKDSNIYKQQTSAYELKYSLNVDKYEERNFRYMALEAAAEKIVEAPIFGYGVGQSGYLIQEHLKLNKVINSHNFFANELLDYGLIGFSMLFIFLWQLYRLLLKIPNSIVVQYASFDVIHKVTLALAAFMPFRFFLYYHRFDQTYYFIWASLIVICYGTLSTGWQEADQEII
ncbi:MAG: O-antigen ligase family protein [Cytophagaceae bacterium]|nr:O-antigen ligase family protein [Cytophagaceae bacterium]